MTSRSEALKLHIGSEGPIGGVYSKNNNQNLLLYNPLVFQGVAGGSGQAVLDEEPDGGINIQHDDPNGIFHFTNWEAKLTSLQVDKKERFEVSGASNYLTYSYGAKKIKILDDIAAVAYPEYTHLNKTVWQHENGGLYEPWVNSTSVGYDFLINNYAKYSSKFFLPILNQFGAYSYGIVPDFSNMFIIVEYDGYYSNASGGISNDGATDTEVFRYTNDPNSEVPGTFYADINFGHLRFNSRHSIGGPATYFTDGTNSNPRIASEAHVTKDISELEDTEWSYAPDTITGNESTGDTVLRLYEEEINGFINLTNPSYAWGFLGYSKITIVKYYPIEKCGRVDLYTRKSGYITAFTNDGVVTSANHNLQNNDIVKISSGLDSADIDNDINGVKYIQINDSNTFTLYEDDQFSNRTTISDLDITHIPVWTLLGNTQSANRQGWTFHKSISSPDGKNGMSEITGTWGTNTDDPLPIRFNEKTTYVDIFEEDYGFSFLSPTTTPTQTDYFNTYLPIRKKPSRNDALWLGPQHGCNDYRFGHDIDLIKDGNIYKLLIGEPGPDVLFEWDTNGKHLPDTAPYGKAHLVSITKEADKSLTVALVESINASSGSSGLIETPRELVGATGINPLVYFPGLTRYDNATSQSYNNLTQNKFENVFKVTTNYINDDYWYGAMLYHVPMAYRDIQQDVTIISNIFSDINLNKFNTFIADQDIESPWEIVYPNGFIEAPFYAYIDNFGKSVALEKHPNGHITGAISSTVKPTISASNDVGYVFIYNFNTSLQIGKYSGNGVIPSGTSWRSYYDKARDFANCIIANNGNLLFGKPKAEIVIKFSINFNVFNNETSLIYHYKWNGSTYESVSTIENINNFTNSFRGNDIHRNRKENFLRNGENSDIPSIGWIIYPTDRFGKFFAYDNHILVVNAFDLYNDEGLRHDDTNDGSRLFPDLLCDYLNVYEFDGVNNWVYVDKLSATINSTYNKYSYNSVLYPNASVNLRSLGNKNYDNNRLNSITWDVDLTNVFAIADDRIILKDPLGYAIFRRNWNASSNASTIDNPDGDPDEDSNTLIEANLYPYFKYQEDFTAYELNLKTFHTKFSRMYKYSPIDEVKFKLSSTDKISEAKMPVYFISMPEFTIDVLKIRVTFNQFITTSLSNLKLVIYRRDPRLNYVIDSDYAYIRNGYEIYSEVPGGLYLIDKQVDGRNIGRNGAMDAHKHHEYTTLTEEPWAKLYSGISETNNSITYYVNMSDINYYTISGSQLQNCIRVFNRTPYLEHLSLDLLDVDKATYDPTIDVNNTLIIGFMPIQAQNEKIYRIPLASENKDIDFSVTIDDLEITTNDFPDSELEDPGAIRTVVSVYDCINDVVSTYDNYTQQTGDNGRLQYTNPVLGLGTSLSATHYDATSGSYIYDGTFSLAYQMLSVDNYYINPGDFVNGIQNEVRSLDIQKLEYLPLLLYSSNSKDNTLPLIINGGGSTTGSIDLFLKSTGKNKSLNLHLRQSGITDSLDLFTAGHVPGTGNVNLYLANNFSTGNLNLHIQSKEPASGTLPLYLQSVGVASGFMPLHIGNIDYNRDSLNLYTYGTADGGPIVDPDSNPVATGAPYNHDMWLNIIGSVGPGGTGDPNSGYLNNNLSITLWQNIHTNNDNILNLSMPVKQGITSNVNLFLNNNGVSNSLNLFTRSSSDTTNSLNLFIPSGVGSINNNMSIFTRGYEE